MGLIFLVANEELEEGNEFLVIRSLAMPCWYFLKMGIAEG
ncbi:hypothetical protein FOLKNPGA_00916 [Legionella sp. PC1000]|nr:hypothetical protein FOLKNPGA_00916 [Legionella sp. PC1000]